MSQRTKVIGPRASTIWLLVTIAIVVTAGLVVGAVVLLPQRNAEQHYEAGVAFENAAEWEAAQAEYMHVISIDADYRDVKVRVAEVTGELAAARASIPTATALALEQHYQHALGLINLAQWIEAQAELRAVFDFDPNYKDVQPQLVLVNAKVAKLTPAVVPSSTTTMKSSELPPIALRTFSSTGNPASHPVAEVEVPSEYKIIGGGARVNWTGSGNLLTSSYPATLQRWVATSKDHREKDPATITVWAVAIHDPADQWEVRVFQQTSTQANHPSASVSVPSDYTMTGGGAQVHWTGAGNLLTASFPAGPHRWEARSKDHGDPSPATITVYAIGVRARNGATFPETRVFHNESVSRQHPNSTVEVEDGYILLSGGALVNWTGLGNLLYASWPAGDGSWTAASKDHQWASPATITVYAIGFKNGSRHDD